jgi:transketolase
MSEIAKLTRKEIEDLSKTCKRLRKDVLMMIHRAKSGHPGGSLSVIDILSVLYFKCLKHNPGWNKSPDWENRDRFILAKGHASAALYAVLAEAGYFDKEELKTFRALHSRLQGHPSFGLLPGIEVSTGSLGQGLSMACGVALGLKLDKKNSHVFTILGDGEIQEGQVWEAAMTAAHYKLGNLTAIIDRNCLQIDGNTECIMSLGKISEKWASFGWQVLEINGHDYQEIYEALQKSRLIGNQNNTPVVIIANTIKGKGVSFMENNVSWHGKAPNDEEFNLAICELRG